jgi:hypothetical protein
MKNSAQNKREPGFYWVLCPTYSDGLQIMELRPSPYNVDGEWFLSGDEESVDGNDVTVVSERLAPP